MGYYGKLELKTEARKLRTFGDSYNQISTKLKIPKSTVSDWCKDIILSEALIEKLYQNKITGSIKGSKIAAQRKIAKRQNETEQLYKQGLVDTGILTDRDKFIAGIAFYSAEGTKTDKGCAFANSDPLLIKFMVDWFKQFGNVPMEKFHAAIWIHRQNDELEAKKYWSQLTRIPIQNFYKTYITENKDKSKKIRKQKHPYGVFSIYISNVRLQRKIMGWIGGIIQKPMV